MNSMKRILSTFLGIMIITLHVLPVYAENNVHAIELDLEGRSKQNGIWIAKESPKIETPSTPSQKVRLRLEKENIPIKSSLQKDYTLIHYRIKNNSLEPIEVLISSNLDPSKTLSYLEVNKKRFPRVYLLIPSTLIKAKEDLSGAFTVNNGILFFAALLSGGYNACIKFPLSIVQSIWYTIAAPYYSIRDKQDNELIQQDFSVLESQKMPNSICPNGEMEFYVLVFKANSGIRTLFITVKRQNGAKYKFRY